uniref:Ankyrin repeat and SOCS box protein 5-like n=1 Tax=Sinocyclocheilus rhinocerous TaxID=307959 RepID=A0A673GGQ5_9TELE
MTETTEECRPFTAQLSNVYLTILALFCFKLFVRITLNLLTHFYIIKGNRKEAARISAEFYDNGQGHGSWADRSALHDAASQGRLLALKTLIAQGHSVNVLTIDHISPLHEACIGSHVACARALIDAGANRGTNLETPLHAAAQKDCISIVKLLLEFGADVNACNLEYKRPVEVAPPGSLTEGFLLIYEATPRSLRQLCRQQIRESLGRSRLHLLSHLPLPKAMKNFLQYR